MVAEQDSSTLQIPKPSISHDTDLLLYTSHPYSISIHFLILTLQYTSHPYSISIHFPILTLQYTSHPENNPIHLPSSHFHKPPSSQHSHSPPILMPPYTSHSLSQLLRDHSRYYLPVYLPAAGCQDARCNWRLVAGFRFWITCGLQAPWGWGSAASWTLSWHCSGRTEQTLRSPSKSAKLLTLGYRWPQPV